MIPAPQRPLFAAPLTALPHSRQRGTSQNVPKQMSFETVLIGFFVCFGGATGPFKSHEDEICHYVRAQHVLWLQSRTEPSKCRLEDLHRQLHRIFLRSTPLPPPFPPALTANNGKLCKSEEFNTLRPKIRIWVVVKIMVPFWVPSIIRHLIFRVPKKERNHNSDNHPYLSTKAAGR